MPVWHARAEGGAAEALAPTSLDDLVFTMLAVLLFDRTLNLK